MTPARSSSSSEPPLHPATTPQSSLNRTPNFSDCWESPGPVWGSGPAGCSSHPPPPPEGSPGSRRSRRYWPCWRQTSAGVIAVLVAALAADRHVPPQSGALNLGAGCWWVRGGAWRQDRPSAAVSGLAVTSSYTASAPVSSRLSHEGKAEETKERGSDNQKEYLAISKPFWWAVAEWLK